MQTLRVRSTNQKHILPIVNSIATSTRNGDETPTLFAKTSKKNEKPPKFPSNYWDDLQNQKSFLTQFAMKRGLKSQEWNLVSQKEIRKAGGAGLLTKFSNNMKNMLDTIFPGLNIELDKKYEHKYWIDLKNQREFLSSFAKEHNIKNPSDWRTISLKKIQDAGGGALLNQYKSNLKKLLEFVFPEYNFSTNLDGKSPTAYWKVHENQRIFLNDFAKKHNIKTAKDWRYVTNDQIIEAGGATLLRLFSNTKTRMLQSVFPEIDFKGIFYYKNSSKFWNSPENQKKFLEKFASQNQIRQPKDWGSFTYLQLTQGGAKALLHKYGNSPIRMLRAVYPGINWKIEWFKNAHKYTADYWKSNENCRKFLISLESKAAIVSLHDWKRISNSFILKHGGKGLLQKYGGSILTAMKALYPKDDWENVTAVTTASRQQHLESLVKVVFPSEKVVRNSRRHNLELIS